MPLRRVKTRNNERIRNFSKSAAKKIQNEFIDQSLPVSSVDQTIQSNDTNMTVMFPSYVVYNIVTNAKSNFIFNLKFNIIKQHVNKHPIAKEFIDEIQRMTNSGILTDKDGFIVIVAHKRLASDYIRLVDIGIINENLLRQDIIKYSSTYKLMVLDSTTSDVVGASEVYVNVSSRSKNIYENKSVEALGSDSFDVSKPGLAAEEAYRLFFFNGEKFQQIQATYDTTLSSINPGQYGDKRMHVVKTATLKNPVNKI